MDLTTDWQLFPTSGLADNTYLLRSDNEALLIDPQRDAWRFLTEIERNNLKLRYIVETHIHNDYVSGAMEIHAKTGAEIVAPSKGRYRFSYKPVGEGDELQIGSARLVALETPGHTPEHISWLLYTDGSTEPVAVFTGGSLLSGSAGRTDLRGPRWTDKLTRLQFESLKRLGSLPPGVQILPTHGGGSFCAAAKSSGEPTSVLAEELRSNPALQAKDYESFAAHQLKSQPHPRYYTFMLRINKAGAPVLGELPQIDKLSAEQVSAAIESGVWVIDIRNRFSFAAEHIPGSINIELNENFGTYVGWMVPFGCPVVLVIDKAEPESLQEAITQLIRIGYDRVSGLLKDGIENWRRSGFPVTSYDVGSVEDFCRNPDPAKLIDVRQESEWNEAHVEDSIHAFVGDLAEEIPDLPDDETLWIACTTGYRAAIAASFLHRRRIRVRLLAQGGIPDLIKSCPTADVHK